MGVRQTFKNGHILYVSVHPMKMRAFAIGISWNEWLSTFRTCICKEPRHGAFLYSHPEQGSIFQNEWRRHNRKERTHCQVRFLFRDKSDQNDNTQLEQDLQ
jgi:hypothetical protein